MTATPPAAIQAAWPAAGLVTAEAVDGRRRVAGVAVPWGVPGVVSSGDTVVFHRGSLNAEARPVLLRDHDRTRPIGRVVEATDDGRQLNAAARVSATSDGNDALVLAADGALPMFSVGAVPTDAAYDAAGVLQVHAAEWVELSLLSIGAYDAARVSSVTANRGVPAMTDTLPTVDTDDPDVPDVPDVPDDDDDDDEVEGPATVEGARAVPLAAARGRHPATPARHPYADVSLRRMSSLIAAAAATGDPRTVAGLQRIMTSPGARTPVWQIEAQLSDVTLVGADNIASAYRPGYQAELVEMVSHGAPLPDAFRQGDLQRGDYPNVGFNVWTKTPQVALQTVEKELVNSVPISISPSSAPVQTWATGNDISQQVLDFGSPSFVEDYIRAAGVDYADVIQTYAVTVALAAAQNVATAVGDPFVTIVGKMIAGLDPTKVPAGGMFLAVPWDGWTGIIGTKQADGPAYWEGRVSFGSMLPTADVGGLSVFYAPGLPARTYLLGLRNAGTWYDLPGTPFSLRAVNVGNLGLDVAVYGYGALGIQYPYALVKTTVPAAA